MKTQKRGQRRLRISIEEAAMLPPMSRLNDFKFRVYCLWWKIYFLITPEFLKPQKYKQYKVWG